MINRLSEIFAKVRVKASRLQSKILLGSIVGGLPLTSIRSLEEVLYRDFIKNYVVDLISIYKPIIVNYDFPPNYPAYFRRNKTFDKRNLYLLKDVCVSPDSGMVWLPEGYILTESVGSLLRIMGWGGVLHEPILPIKGLHNHDLIIACPPTGYFHWLFEIMPNILHALSNFPDANILVSTKSPKYILNALTLLLGPEAHKTRMIFSQGPLQISNLIMPQVESYSGFVHPKYIEILRKVLKAKADTSGNITEKFIYISRSRSPKRKLANEIDLEDRLREIGFNIIYAEELLFLDQINYFSEARFIIGPHGAGLSNMVWADSPCEIIEIFPFGLFNDCFARLALTLGFRYDYDVCEQDENSMGRIPIDPILKTIKDKFTEL